MHQRDTTQRHPLADDSRNPDSRCGSQRTWLGLAAASAICIAASAHASDTRPPVTEETIVITASPLAKDADQFATLVERIERDEILRQGGANLADSLVNQPGIAGSSFAAGASRPVIRGFDANRVRVLENGIGTFDVSDVGPDHGVPIDPLSTSRIEVVRGAATLRYGSQAIGGVVNAINERIPTRLPEQALSAELLGSYGSSAEAREGAASVKGRLGSFAYTADAFDRRADDYDTPEGTLSNSFSRGNGYSLGGSWFFGDGRIGAGAAQYDAEYGIPGEDTFIDLRQTKFMTQSSIAIDAGALRTLSVAGGYADYEHSERDDSGMALSTFKDNEWDARVEALFGTVGPLTESALGIQLQNRNFSALGGGAEFLLPTATRTSAAFLFTEAALASQLRLQAGARVERVRVDGTPASDVPTSRVFTPLSASLGLIYDATEAVRVGFTLASAARAPAQTELYARGPHDGPVTFETGDATLGIERANSVEATLRIRAGRARFEAALWTARFDGYIYGALTGRLCDEDGDCDLAATASSDHVLQELNFEHRDAKFSGAEARATLLLSDSAAGVWNAELVADAVRATLDGAGNVPRLPPYRVAAALNWTTDAFDAGVRVRYSGRQDRTAFAETPTAGFTSVDAQLGWRPPFGGDTLQLMLIGRNLTDSTQRNSVAFNKDDVILPGRDLRLVVRARF